MKTSNDKPLILVIDDEASVRGSVRAYLEDCDYRVIEAEHGGVGLERFERDAPDLVLVDLRMPEVDGLTVLSQIRDRDPQAPVLVVSGTGVIDDVVEALRLGAWDYLLKPIRDMEVLRHAVDRALERAELLRERSLRQRGLELAVAERTEKLAEANQRLTCVNDRMELALNTARLGIWEWRDGVLELDERAKTLLDQDRFDAQTPFDELLHPLDRRLVWREIRRLIRGKIDVFEMEHRIQNRDGSIIWVLNRAKALNRDPNGVATCLTGVWMDITKRKKTELALCERERELRTVVERNPIPMLITDAAGVVVHVNAKVTTMFGYRDEDFNMQWWRLLLRLDDLPPLEDLCGRVWKLFGKPKDGVEEVVRDVEIQRMAFSDEMAVVAIHDVTEHKQVEQRMRQFNRELERCVVERTKQLETAQEALVEKAHRAGMAVIATDSIHNIGNILNSVNVSINEIGRIVIESKGTGLDRITKMVQTHADNLAEYFTADKRGRLLPKYMETLAQTLHDEKLAIREELQCLTDQFVLIRDVVATQQNYAKINMRTRNTPVTEVIEDALKLQAPTLARYRVTLERDYRIRAVGALAKVKLVHVLTNLIKNACEAMNDAPDPRILRLRLTYEGESTVVIEVIDSGCGVTPENEHRIFQHGFTTKDDGFGFGLHSCANLMTEMGGTLSVTSDGEGKGATFLAKFPLRDGRIEKFAN